MKTVIGLTGGIGSGKTTVAGHFAALGATVIDTDALAHGLTAPGGAAMAAIADSFGPAFVAPDGALDRAAMRQRVFGDEDARRQLEAILHPLIRAEADAAIARSSGLYAVLAVPLLFETRGFADRVARTVVVDCPEERQVERVVARSGIAPAEVRAVMAAQWPRWRRLQAADDVVWNGGSPDLLAPQCERLHRAYATMPRG